MFSKLLVLFRGLAFPLAAAVLLLPSLQCGFQLPSSDGKITLTGAVQLGRVAGSTVSVYKVTDGARGDLITTAETAEDGSYSIEMDAVEGPILVVATGGTYTDESTGEEVAVGDDEELTSLVPYAKTDAKVPLTPMSDMLTQRAVTISGLLGTNQGITFLRTAALQEVSEIWGASYATTLAVPNDPDEPGEPSSYQGQSAFLCAVFSQFLKDNNLSPAQGVSPFIALNLLKIDYIPDGKLDGKILGVAMESGMGFLGAGWETGMAAAADNFRAAPAGTKFASYTSDATGLSEFEDTPDNKLNSLMPSDSEEEEESDGSLDITTSSAALTISTLGTLYAGSDAVYPRSEHAMAVLSDGRVVISGGRFTHAMFGTLILSGIEVYTPDTEGYEQGLSAASINMSVERYNHSMVALDDDKVLILGGYKTTGATSSAEVYDPDAETTTAVSGVGCAPTISGSRSAIKLANGKVLVVGGGSTTAELYDPGTGCFAATGSLATSRNVPQLVLLNSGKVLVVGGTTASATMELYNPVAGTFSNTAQNLSEARTGMVAVKLASGNVLIAGGTNASSTVVATAEIYNPVADSVAAATGNLNTARTGATANLITAGAQVDKVYVIGGLSTASVALKTIEVFDATAGTFTVMSKEFSTGYSNHRTAMIDGNKIFITGGTTGTASTNIVDTTLGAVIAFTASGGTAPYAYSLEAGAGSMNATTGKLCVGTSSQTVTAKVTDDATATDTKDVVITAATP